MNQKFQRVAPRLYKRMYDAADGGTSALFYARLVCRLKGVRRWMPLGGDQKTAKEELKILDARNIRREDFDADRERQKPTSAPEPMTIEKWSGIYLEMEETKSKRSYARDEQLIASVNSILGAIPLMDLKRAQLFDYRKKRLDSFIIRNRKPSKVKVKPGTVANELSCLRHMMNIARQSEVDAATPSFKGLIERTQRDRILTPDERADLLTAFPVWMRRVAEVANETSLSEGDIIRLTKPMINRRDREIVPAGGRAKTKVCQRAPLTDRVLEILDEIELDKRAGKIVANLNGLVFTREDGRAVTKDMITGAIKTARKRAKVENFRFHDYRHCAKTEWARRGVQVDHAMLASGHKSVAMHQRYVNLQAGDVGKAFGLKMVYADGIRETSAENDNPVTTRKHLRRGGRAV